MSINFDVELTKFPDNKEYSVTAAAIETFLDDLSITTLHALTVTHKNGFYEVIVIYV